MTFEVSVPGRCAGFRNQLAAVLIRFEAARAAAACGAALLENPAAEAHRPNTFSWVSRGYGPSAILYRCRLRISARSWYTLSSAARLRAGPRTPACRLLIARRKEVKIGRSPRFLWLAVKYGMFSVSSRSISRVCTLDHGLGGERPITSSGKSRLFPCATDSALAVPTVLLVAVGWPKSNHAWRSRPELRDVA